MLKRGMLCSGNTWGGEHLKEFSKIDYARLSKGFGQLKKKNVFVGAGSFIRVTHLCIGVCIHIHGFYNGQLVGWFQCIPVWRGLHVRPSVWGYVPSCFKSQIDTSDHQIWEAFFSVSCWRFIPNRLYSYSNLSYLRCRRDLGDTCSNLLVCY